MRKFKWFMDAAKEEKWLNSMSTNGWSCTRVNGLGMYEFKEHSAADQVVRIDFQTFSSQESYQDYLQLHQDFGWTHIGGSQRSSLQYWRKTLTGDDFLFSDSASQKAYYKRLSFYYGSFALFFFVLTISMLDNFNQFTSIQAAYFTPGLWEKQGLSFVFSFLFETPFALMRFGSPWLLLFFGMAFAIAYLRFDQKKKSML